MRSLLALQPLGAAALCSLVIGCLMLGGAQRSAGQNAQQGSPWGVDQSTSSSRDGLPETRGGLPDAPDQELALGVRAFAFPAAMASTERSHPWDVTPDGTAHQEPFSRVGIGVGVSPLGIGASGSIVLTEYFDGRLSGNFFRFNMGRFEADGMNVYAGLHLASGAVSADYYPFNIPIRVSGGLMFFNTNHLSGTMRVAPGTGFTLNGESFYAGAEGTNPLMGSAAVAFHAIRPAPTLTFGFGKFIPRSDRHWSFPSEFGVAFTGSPTITVNMKGTVCSDPGLTMCSEISDTSSPVGTEFNSALQAKLASWRRSLSRVEIFPIFSGGVSYSFDTPWGWTPKAKF